jgi:hypothetical protein
VASALDLADWVIPQWEGTLDRVRAVMVGLAEGANVNGPRGAFGVGGPPGDGPGQARTLRELQGQQGWTAVPAFGTGRAALFYPIAAAAVAERAVQQPVTQAAAAVGGAVAGPAETAAKLAGGFGETFAVVHWLTMPDTWIRGVKIVAGLGLIIVGSGMLAFKTGTQPFSRLLRGGGERAGYVAEQSAGVRQSMSQGGFWGSPRSDYTPRHSKD